MNTTTKSPRVAKPKAAKAPAKKTAKKTAKKKPVTKVKAVTKAKPAKRSKERLLSTENGNSKGIKVEFYMDAKREARWRLVKRGKIIGASTEGYKRVASARSNFKGLREAMGLIKV